MQKRYNKDTNIMAKADDFFGIRGKMGNNVFRQLKSGSYVKPDTKDPINQTDATKKASGDFTRANQFASRVHTTFRQFVKSYGDVTTSKFTTSNISRFGKRWERKGRGEILSGSRL